MEDKTFELIEKLYIEMQGVRSEMKDVRSEMQAGFTQIDRELQNA